MRMWPNVPDGVVTGRARKTVGMLVATSSAPHRHAAWPGPVGDAMSAAASTARRREHLLLRLVHGPHLDVEALRRLGAAMPSPVPSPSRRRRRRRATCQSRRISRATPSRPR